MLNNGIKFAQMLSTGFSYYQDEIIIMIIKRDNKIK